MRTRAVLSSLLLLALVAAAAVGQDAPKKKKPEVDGEAKAIRAAIDSYVEAYNAADAQRVAEHWSEQAVYIRPGSGEKVTGRKAIAKVFAEVFAGEERSKLRVAVDSIRLVTPDVAIEDGTARVVSPDGEEEKTTYTAVHVKTKEGWKLDSVRETEAASESETAAEQLAQLDWMLGNWIDAGDDATVEYSAHYAKNKSFIVRLFKVSIPGAIDLEGTQVIGWDPAAKTIRSWVFDSQQGFSEGIWTRDGSDWIVKSQGYVAGGRRSSSVATFRPLDEETISWKMEKRQVGDEKLPDIAEVKIIRK